jgi:predicted chitinase
VTQADIDRAYANNSPSVAKQIIAGIAAATDSWNNAKTTAEKAAAHAEADRLRGITTNSDGTTPGAGASGTGGNTYVYLGTSDTKKLATAQTAVKSEKTTSTVASLVYTEFRPENTQEFMLLSSHQRGMSIKSINYGSKEDSVGYYQWMLYQLGYYNGIYSSGLDRKKVADGNFGQDTLTAFLRFQIQNGWRYDMYWDDLFNADGSYKGVSTKILSTLAGNSIEGLRKQGYSYSAWWGKDYNPANETTIFNGKVYKNLVTKDQLEQVFFETSHHKQGSVTVAMVKDLNRVLYSYNITSTDLIQYFLGVCMHESRNALTEAGYLSRENQIAYLRKKRYYPYYGAGYIQLTGETNYRSFANDLGIQGLMNMSDPAQYIANDYAWDAAGWWWKNGDMNRRIVESQAQGLNSTDIFWKVSNAVYRGPNNYNSTLKPGDWDLRLTRYQEVCGVIK